jgi:membrane-bound metal-dependent hydrolase YbcI (DUF457 family)
MMGRTHALGGAAALAGVSLATGVPMPAWAFAAAAVAGLLPDADNHQGTMMNRPKLITFKIMALPLWYGAVHRGRTHSFVGTAFFALLIAGWVWAAAWIAAQAGVESPFTLRVWLVALVAGYISHPALDLLNRKPVDLFWPIPHTAVMLPFGFKADSFGNKVTASALILFLSWFALINAGAISTATTSDPALPHLVPFLLGAAQVSIDALAAAIHALTAMIRAAQAK